MVPTTAIVCEMLEHGSMRIGEECRLVLAFHCYSGRHRRVTSGRGLYSSEFRYLHQMQRMSGETPVHYLVLIAQAFRLGA